MSEEVKKVKIKDDFDFWTDATSFVKTLVPVNIEELIVAHMVERKFNDNEIRLSREYITKAFDMYVTMAYLKHLCNKQSEQEISPDKEE